MRLAILCLPYLEPQCIMSSMAARDTNPNFMNGVPELLILRLLKQEEMYGYEIVQAIRDCTDAVIAVGEGVVYPVLHGLERDGALRSRRKNVNGRSRIYYSVTPRDRVDWLLCRGRGRILRGRSKRF